MGSAAAAAAAAELRMHDRAALSRIAPFAVYISFILIGDLLPNLGLGALDVRWLYALKIALVSGLLFWFRDDYAELAWQPIRAAALAVAVGAGVVVWVLWINLNADWMQLGKSAGFDPHTDGELEWSLLAIRLVGASLVVPLMEELFWRSYLLRWMESSDFLKVVPSSVKAASFMVMVVLFGVEHTSWLAGMVAGLVYGLLYTRTGRLWMSIISHAVTNCMLGLWIIATANWQYW